VKHARLRSREVIHGDADRTVPIAASGLRLALADLQAAIAAKRLRPKFMTVATMFVGWATGTGSDVWKRIAAAGWRHLYLILSSSSSTGDLRNLEVALRANHGRAKPQPARSPACRRPRRLSDSDRT
jgi:hypothetical protein